MNKEDLLLKLDELFIRFNTSPKLYLKRDYLVLLGILKLIINNLTGLDLSIDNRLNLFKQEIINSIGHNIESIVDDRLSHIDFQPYVDTAIEKKEFNIFAGVVNPDGVMKLNIIVDENGNATFIQL